MKVTAIHCAEVLNTEECKAMIYLRPNRLGHCTFLHPKYGGDEDVWELYKKSGIPVGNSCGIPKQN